jgi:mono/diheme cytochrome c family protein
MLLMCAALAGCGENMTDQAKYQEYEPGPLFRNGRVLQAPVSGTVARGDLERDKSRIEKPPLSDALLARGREQFDVFCSPCHARTGDGNGVIVQRGMPHPPSFHGDRLRTADDQHFFDVISNGYGAMFSYADRVSPHDRWAVIAYIRALQLSQDAKLDDVPMEVRQRLLEAP